MAEQTEVEARAEADRQVVSEQAAAEQAALAQAADDAAAARVREQADRDRARREAAERDAERSRARQAELAEEAARVAHIEDLPAARRQFAAIRREWVDVSAHAAPAPEATARYAEAETAFGAREAAARDEEQKSRREALARLQLLAVRVEALAGREDLTLKAGERALRDVRAALSTLPPLPSKRDHDEILQRFKALQTALMPKIQELREVAGWQRWANVGIQEQLVEKMEALKSMNDADAEQIAHHVKDLQQQWRQAADVPRPQGEVLWRRFKAAHDEVWAKCEAYFAAQAEARNTNLAKKVALCERAEALADSTNWIQTADEIKKLQADWKTIGPVSRGQEKAIWERFRSACDRFFTRRHADLAERKAVWSENLAKKEALIAKVDALAESTDWDATAAEIKRIQAEWRTIGPVKKSRSEALWQRFRGACDRFFTRFAQRHDLARGERVAAREAIVAELEALANAAAAAPDATAPLAAAAPPDAIAPPDASTPPVAAAPPDVAATLRALRSRWQQEIAARGVDRERAAALDDRFAAAFARVIAQSPAAFAGTDLDPDSNRRRMESLVIRMEDLAGSLAGGAVPADAALSPTTKLAAMLKEALAANTIGGKVDNESRFRAANDEVRQAQATWSRIGPVPDEVRRALADRFQRAIRRISDAQGGRDVRDDRRGARPDSRGPAGSPDLPPGRRPEGRREKQEVGR
jgi:hypothetical protein